MWTHSSLISMNRFAITYCIVIFEFEPCNIYGICYIEPFMFSCLNANSSSGWTACRTSHTPWSGWLFLLHSLIAHSSSEWTVCRISHTHWYGYLFLLFFLIANSSVGSTICTASHIQLKSELSLMSPPSQTFCIFFDDCLHHHLRLMIAHSFVKGSLVIVSR